MKIDITKIDGYESMTIEEKLNALEGYEFDTSGYVKKDSFDKTASDLASYKKKYKELLSAEEQAKLEREEELNQIQEELKTLKMEKQLSEMTSQYLSLGYEDDLAKSTAKAFIDGDMTKVFENQKLHQSNMEKKVKADILKDTPQPKEGNAKTGGMTKEQLRAMSPQERFAYSQANPEEYKAIYEN